ncbi:MAG: c-type cytochrome [Pedobacter sp.]
MQRSVWMLVMACLGMMLVTGCGREESQENSAAVSQKQAMPMEHDMGSGMDAMHEMDHDMMATTAVTDDGAALFQQHCAVCHPGGSNIITPAKTLDRQTLEKNGITTVEDILAIVRKPGPGMTPFGPEQLFDKQAEQVAEHILSTY